MRFPTVVKENRHVYINRLYHPIRDVRNGQCYPRREEPILQIMRCRWH